MCAGEVFCIWTSKQISKVSFFIATFISLAALHSELDAKHDYCKLLSVLTVNNTNLPSSASKVVWGSQGSGGKFIYVTYATVQKLTLFSYFQEKEYYLVERGVLSSIPILWRKLGTSGVPNIYSLSFKKELFRFSDS